MKKIALISLICLILCGCNNKDDYVEKSKYNSLNKKYNELKQKYDITSEQEYINNYITGCSVQKGQMGKFDILEIFCDPTNFEAQTILEMSTKIVNEQWFKYDYILLHAYGFGQIYGTIQLDGKTGALVTSTGSSN